MRLVAVNSTPWYRRSASSGLVIRNWLSVGSVSWSYIVNLVLVSSPVPSDPSGPGSGSGTVANSDSGVSRTSSMN